ncbi:hypothetical protein CBLAS_0372 [Campylobacter blaseri]|uniref:Uncharacterized protein n=2 Tax=Campylobacter blaseri TaxID=2042961 RepID=A0A2P8R0Q8_9BACT|nr:hypothetical protein CQ405_05875 [Campylobacter blaseri]PSM53868.1 hypothetical protein CRN67_05875 [Campylobacter blaseri]QKF85576.1 hypothetical protein CBLAS_0372 [Campylobacter blaseri]
MSTPSGDDDLFIKAFAAFLFMLVTLIPVGFLLTPIFLIIEILIDIYESIDYHKEKRRNKKEKEKRKTQL